MYLNYFYPRIFSFIFFLVVFRNHPVRLFFQMSCKCNSSLKDEPILMKLYTVEDMNKNKPCRKYLKNKPDQNYLKDELGRNYLKDKPGRNYLKGDI